MIQTIKAIYCLLTGKPDEVVIRGNAYKSIGTCKIKALPETCTINGWKHELIDMELELGWISKDFESHYRSLSITAGPPLPPEVQTVGRMTEQSKRQAEERLKIHARGGGHIISSPR